MKIGEVVQAEIIEVMFLERDKLADKLRHESEDSSVKMWLRGMINGMSHAMGILSAWNEPNHGKVRASTYPCREEDRYDKRRAAKIE
jgi:hypothetical protein